MTDQISSGGVATADTVVGDSLLERLPESILNEVFSKIEPPLEKLTTVCSVACVSPTLHLAVNKVLSSFSSIDLSTIQLDSQTFEGIVRRIGKIRKISLDCFRMNDSAIQSFIGPDVEELVLLKCKSVSYELLASIGTTCPNLRMLTLEFSGDKDKSSLYKFILKIFLGDCPYLESLNIKFSEAGSETFHWLDQTYVPLPSLQTSDSVATQQFRNLLQTVKVLKLDPVCASDTLVFLSMFNMGVPVVTTLGHTLTHLTLVLDKITDALVRTLADCLPLLIELDLKDGRKDKPDPSDDLSDSGVLSLVRRCRHLTSISLLRSTRYVTKLFERITNTSMVLIQEGYEGLESVRIGGFSEVSDVGFASILNGCMKLKKFEFQNAFNLTDLSFQNMSMAPRALVEVKLVGCRSITSKAVHELVAACCALEVLDLRHCQNVSDSCLGEISWLTSLTSLILEFADLTDDGMAILGKGNAPISRLSLRGCLRVTEKGIIFLLESEGRISKTLSSLDLSYIQGITDNAITTVADTCVGLTELCIRHCFNVTDASMRTLAMKGTLNGCESNPLQKLDIYECSKLSCASFEFLKKPLFRGLQWIGIGQTRLSSADDALAEIYRERRLLLICTGGCKMGCHHTCGPLDDTLEIENMVFSRLFKISR